MKCLFLAICFIFVFSAFGQTDKDNTKTIHIFVALCDNKYQGIVPVPKAIGNGQDHNNNLYWGALYGIRTYFKKNFTGVILTAAAVAYFGKTLETGSGHFSILFLLSTAIYAILAFWFPSKLVWIFSLISLGSWFGTETGYMSGWGSYFLGMNYPLRFVLFGVILIGASFALKINLKSIDFHKSTYIMGLLYLFIALWLLSIFGNCDGDAWRSVNQIELFHWGIIFGLAAIGAIFYGLKQDDYASRSF